MPLRPIPLLLPRRPAFNWPSEPENLSNSNVKLPQHPAPMAPSNSSSSAFLQVQPPPTALSTCRIPEPANLIQPAPLKEIQTNQQPLLQPQQQGQIPPLPLFPLPSLASPSIAMPTAVTTTSNETKFQHPVFQTENLPRLPSKPVSPPTSSTLTSRRPSKAATANSQKPFHCAECKKSFSTQSGYAKHQQLHGSNQIQKEFSCTYCRKRYTTLSALKMHIRTHTLPCKCEFCGKSFSRPWLLQGHVRTHRGEKPFSCEFCSRSFADKSNLRAHLQTHLQTKKYSCPKCNKTFSRMSLLNKHTEAPSGCAAATPQTSPPQVAPPATTQPTRNEQECVQTLIGLSSGLIRT